MRLKDKQKETAIIDETLKLVTHKGIAGLKMADLANNVGISPSTLYVYYKNKESLIISIFIKLIEQQSALSRKQLQEDLPYKLKLKKIWLQWLHFSVNNYMEMNFIKQVKKSPYVDLIPPGTMSLKAEVGVEIFEIGKRELVIKDLDNKILMVTMGAILEKYSLMVINKEISLTKENSDLMFSLVWDAIKA